MWRDPIPPFETNPQGRRTSMVDLPHVPGGYDIELASGRFLDLSAPDPASITLGDVARGLSHMCRFAGQCRRFYSVAEHAVLVASRLEALGFSREICLAGLHHDDAEAFCGDVVRALKHLLPEYRVVEDRVFAVAVEALALADLPFHDPAVKEADNWALAQEADSLMPSRGERWFTHTLTEGAPWGLGWTPAQARVRWVQRHYALTVGAVAA